MLALVIVLSGLWAGTTTGQEPLSSLLNPDAAPAFKPQDDLVVMTTPDTAPGFDATKGRGLLQPSGGSAYDVCLTNLYGLHVGLPDQDAAMNAYYANGRVAFREPVKVEPPTTTSDARVPSTFPCSLAPGEPIGLEQGPVDVGMETGFYLHMEALTGRNGGSVLQVVPGSVQWVVATCNPTQTTFLASTTNPGHSSSILSCQETGKVDISSYVLDLNGERIGTTARVPHLSDVLQHGVGSQYVVSCLRFDAIHMNAPQGPRYVDGVTAHDWFFTVDTASPTWTSDLVLSADRTRWSDLGGANGCPVSFPERVVTPDPNLPCFPSNLHFDGPEVQLDQGGTAYLGAVNVASTVGPGRTLTSDRIHVPSGWITAHQEFPEASLRTWSIVPLEPGFHEVQVELHTDCIPPFDGLPEDIVDIINILVPGNHCPIWRLEDAQPNFQYIVGLQSLPPGITVGSLWQAGTVVDIDNHPNSKVLTLEVSLGAYPVFAENVQTVPGLRYCVQNTQTVERFATPNDDLYNDQWAPSSVLDMESLWDDGYHKSSTSGPKTLCIIDSGIDTTHPAFDTSRIVQVRDDASGGTAFADVQDVEGHGTFVASIAAGETDDSTSIASAAGLDLMVYRDDPSTDAAWIEAIYDGIFWCVDNGADVISMSTGATPPTDPAIDNALSDYWEDAIDHADTNGVLAFFAVGNTGCAGGDCVSYPARFSATSTYAPAYSNVVGVGCNTDTPTGHCSFSSSGPGVTVIGPGENILGACPATLPMCDPSTCNYTGAADHCRLDGTSFATPWVAGAAALIWSHVPGLTPAQVRQYLECSTYYPSPLGPQPHNDWGWGAVDAFDAYTAAKFSSCTFPPCGAQIIGPDGTVLSYPPGFIGPPAMYSYYGPSQFTVSHLGSYHAMTWTATASDGASVIVYNAGTHDARTIYVGDYNTRYITLEVVVSNGSNTCTVTATWEHTN